MIFKLKIMSDGDQVLNCWDDKIAIRRANGEVDIYQIAVGENNLPTLSDDIWRITYGNNIIEITDKDSTSKSKGSSKSKGRTKSSKSTESSVSSNKNGNLSPHDDEDDADFVMSIRPKKG